MAGFESMSSSVRKLIGPALAVMAGCLVLVAFLTTGDDDSSPEPIESSASDTIVTIDPASIPTGEVRDFGPAPSTPDGPWSTETLDGLDQIVETLTIGAMPVDQFDVVADSGDPRLAWALADILRFVGPGEANERIQSTLGRLVPEIEVDVFAPWGSTIDHLIAWDIPAPAEYATFKREFYSRIEPKWGELMAEGAEIDWRLVGWGGVGIDDRAFGSDGPCNCIPALDNPAVTGADGGDWYPDDALVFGIEIDGEARAYPKNIMEVHEMVNDTLGGRDLAIPYCTLCGSAQAYLTDELPAELDDEYGRPVMRTSGLLIRSNKMMFERNSRSFVDTFTGAATSGPLAEAGVVFDQVSVVTSTWAAWREAHPDTTIIAQDGGLGRIYELDPLGGRDDNGPIFPIGQVDPRLSVQEPVLGLIDDQGRPIAIHVASAVEVLSGGQGRLVVAGFELRLDGTGVRALRDGADAGGHQAFWFAWSQFHPDTALWPHDFA